jgi:ribosomal protein S18 acetylase RimI-like enzyme
MLLDRLLLRRMQDSIQTSAPGTIQESIGGFLVTIHPENRLRWFNDAVPVGECTVHDIKRMIDCFQSHERRPRLEFFQELWPEVPHLLESQGFKLKDSQPASAVTGREFRNGGSHIYARLATAEDAATIDRIGDLAFEGDGVDPLREQAIRDSLLGSRSKAALGFVGGRPVGSGRIVGKMPVREIVSIGTIPTYRKLGVATAVTSALLDDFFLTGGEIAWLTASEHADTLYRRLGFSPVATQVCYLLD